MTTLVHRTSPFGELLTFRRAVQPLFGEPFGRAWTGDWAADRLAMPLDVRVTSEAVLIEAALPGVKPEDVAIELDGQTVTITASDTRDEQTERDGVTVQEIRHGRFGRTVRLPEGLKLDAATAHLEHGLLRLSIPKADEAKPRRIAVTAGPTESQVSPAAAGAPAENDAPQAKAA